MDALAERPLVSVVVPCFNAERWIGETLSSVLSQTYAPLEILVVDDGSTDSSVERVRAYETSGVRLIRQENRGAAAARNAGFAASRGAYIQFLDADDLLGARKIELQVARLLEERSGIACGPWARFSGSPGDAKPAPDFSWRDQDPLTWLVGAWEAGGGMLYPAMWLAPRETVNAAGPWKEYLTLNDDGEFFTRALLASEKVVFVPEAESYYRSNVAGSLSGRKSRRAWESQFLVFALCEAYVREREDSVRVRAACATVWQGIAHAAYPYAPDIANHALGRARALGGARRRPEGGPAFRAVSRLLGWKAARRLQRLSGRN